MKIGLVQIQGGMTVECVFCYCKKPSDSVAIMLLLDPCKPLPQSKGNLEPTLLWTLGSNSPNKSAVDMCCGQGAERQENFEVGWKKGLDPSSSELI